MTFASSDDRYKDLILHPLVVVGPILRQIIAYYTIEQFAKKVSVDCFPITIDGFSFFSFLPIFKFFFHLWIDFFGLLLFHSFSGSCFTPHMVVQLLLL